MKVTDTIQGGGAPQPRVGAGSRLLDSVKSFPRGFPWIHQHDAVYAQQNAWHPIAGQWWLKEVLPRMVTL